MNTLQYQLLNQGYPALSPVKTRVTLHYHYHWLLNHEYPANQQLNQGLPANQQLNQGCPANQLLNQGYPALPSVKTIDTLRYQLLN